MNEPEVLIRAMADSDLESVVAIQQAAYPRTPRQWRGSIPERVRFFPGGCRVAQLNGSLAGYLVSHPWALGAVPAQSGSLDRPPRLDCYYIHDLAVLPQARRSGAGRHLLESAISIARERGFRSVTLTAGRDSERFWLAFGFRAAHQGPALLQARLREYGRQAQYMILSRV